MWALSVAAYVAAMPLVAFYQARLDDEAQRSFMLLLVGPMGVLVGYLEWLANPLIWYSWRMAKKGRWRTCAISSLIAVGLVASFLLRDHMEWPLYERDPRPRITGHGLGFWLWLVSALSMLAAAGTRYMGRRVKAGPEAPTSNNRWRGP